MIRILPVLLLIILMPLGAMYYFSSAREAELQAVMDKNVAFLNQQLAELKEGVTFSYDKLEVSGFFMLPDATFTNPRFTVTTSGRVMTLKAASLVLSPESSAFNAFRLALPPTLTAVDSFQGKEFVYTITPEPIPVVAFRSPSDEVLEQASIENPTIKRMYRGTSPEELKQLPQDIMHQISVNWPRNFNMQLKYGPKEAALHYTLKPLAIGRNWQRIPYHLRTPLLWLFGEITKAIHYGGGAAAQ